MSLAIELTKSVSDFRVLVDIDSRDSLWSGHYSLHSFTPIGGLIPYEGRLVEAPSISIVRDSNFYGIMAYSSSSIELNNADGSLDTLLEDYNIIGATVRIYFGYASVDEAEYIQIFTGYIESVTVNANSISFSIADLKKRLSSSNSTDTKFVNVPQAVENVLLANYPITAGSTYFDVSAMTVAKSFAYDVFRIAPENDTVDLAISDLAKSAMGMFTITQDGRFSYRMVDSSATSVTTIQHQDVLNSPIINYNSDMILAEVAVESPPWGFQQISDLNTFVNLGLANANGYFCTGAVGTASTTVVTALVSGDGGISWSHMTFSVGPAGSHESTYITVLASCPVKSSLGLMAAFNRSEYVYLSLDCGQTWSASQQFSAPAATRKVTAISELANGAVLFGMGIFYSGVFHDATIQWVASAGSGINYERYSASSMSYFSAIGHRNTSDVMAGTGPDAITGLTGPQVHLSTDSGLTWSFLQEMMVGNTINSIIALNENVWILSTSVGVGDGAIYYTSDKGATWIAVLTIPFGIDKMVKLSDGSVIATQASGIGTRIFKSDIDITSGSAGLSWQEIDNISTAASNIVVTGLSGNTVQDGMTVMTGYNGISSFAFRAKLDSSFTWKSNFTYKASTFSVYGVDTLKSFNTFLAYNSPYLYGAASLGNSLISYYKELHGTTSIEVPFKFYYLQIGDMIDVEIWRDASSMLGTKKCEIYGISYNMNVATMVISLRIA